MSSVTFDTLQFVETLQEAGVPENHAKAISKAVRNVYDTAELVTKTDLREAVSELRAETNTLGADLKSEGQRLDSKIGPLLNSKWVDETVFLAGARGQGRAKPGAAHP